MPLPMSRDFSVVLVFGIMHNLIVFSERAMVLQKGGPGRSVESLEGGQKSVIRTALRCDGKRTGCELQNLLYSARPSELFWKPSCSPLSMFGTPVSTHLGTCL